MTILPDHELQRLIELQVIRVEPFDPSLVQPASLDFRLGHQFLLMSGTEDEQVDPTNPEVNTVPFEIDDGDYINMQPGEFWLASSLEVFGFPNFIAGMLGGKSSLGRIGLQVHATAGFFDPGFEGTATLELSNMAPHSIMLKPGMKVGQMVFIRLSSPCDVPYGSPGLGSKYLGQRGPTPASAQRRTNEPR